MTRAFQPPTAPAPPFALVALGSNLGDSAAILRHAIERLRELAASDFRVSSFWTTTPVDCPPGSPPFVNAVVGFVPRLPSSPEQFLARLHALEREAGRRPKLILNEARPLDLDLIGFGAEIRATPALHLPHPRAHQRRFVLQPLVEIAPETRLPGWPGTASELLAALSTDEVLVRHG